MESLRLKRRWGLLVLWCCVLMLSSSLTESTVKTPIRKSLESVNVKRPMASPPVRLRKLNQSLVMDNGLVNVTLSTPQGMVIGIQYGGIENLLEKRNSFSNRGYWDVVWERSTEGNFQGITDLLEGTSFSILKEDENQVEISFTKTLNSPLGKKGAPINIDKRFILLRGSHGFYTYAIVEHPKEGPAGTLHQARVVFKLEESLFTYMAVSDERQRIMPTFEDRQKGLALDYPEAVLLTNPSNVKFKGEVDDKYQYSSDNKDDRVHGWICSNPPVGFWMITPSKEFSIGGPLKQDLTSHVGPTTISMFFSTHYFGESHAITLRQGEPWKKVLGPVFIYLNTASGKEAAPVLWKNAKEQSLIEQQKWPYDFPLSKDYPHLDQRGTVTGRLLVRDRYTNQSAVPANSAYVGLAAPGDAGSWQIESKGYQFWTQADAKGHFFIKGVRLGDYCLYAWVPGVIGDFKHVPIVKITPGKNITLGDVIYEPPREGPTLWEIGIPDRSAAEFFVPDPKPTLMNQLFVKLPKDKFRQYGLWERYSDIYPKDDLVYTVGSSNYQKDWFYAHVPRNIGKKTYKPTTWRIKFDLKTVTPSGNYTLQIALASANEADLQVRINKPENTLPHFTTGRIGNDNSIARHGIHGMYFLYKVSIRANMLISGSNTIYLRQSRSVSPFQGILYDYIRLEGPPVGRGG